MKALLATSAVTVLLAGAVPQEIWIIGGGPDPVDSQAQIEFNVLWVTSVLDEISPDANVSVYFADGNAGGRSVQEWRGEAADSLPIPPLARVFGEEVESAFVYRPHEVPDVLGSTYAPTMVPELEQGFAALEPGDRALILYNGHGTWADDRADNALRLWGDSYLSVREFEKLISGIDPAVPVRFIFTQCYSGAFERAVHPGAEDVIELAPGQRCGFLAESENRESEGCSASIRIGDYRDYTTYFFAALSGRTRLGEPIPGDPDQDGDGTVTPFEAHLYVLAEAYNADLPRSTSEVFLERWQPWYLRWIDTGAIPDNEYGQIVRGLAEANDLPLEPRAMTREVDRRQAELEELERLRTEEVARIQSDIEAAQAEIRSSLQSRWAVVAHPYSAGFRGFLAEDVTEAEQAIVDHPLFADLVESQGDLRRLERDAIDVDRQLAQLEKIRRSRLLARLLDQLRRLGSEDDLAAYMQLRTCESLPV